MRADPPQYVASRGGIIESVLVTEFALCTFVGWEAVAQSSTAHTTFTAAASVSSGPAVAARAAVTAHTAGSAHST